MRSILISALLILSFTGPAQQDFRVRLDSFMNIMEQNHKAMGSLYISKDGEPVYQRSIGYADVKNTKPATESSLYRIGSISKTFTASIIMQLIEEKKLSLATRLSKFFPKIPGADSISIEHLLAHRSGLHNFTNSPDYPNYMTEPRTHEQMLELFEKLETDFHAGERMEYSNTNYVLLAYIAEKVTGKDFAQILAKRITQPLQLEDTYFEKAKDRQREVKSYERAGGEWVEAPITDMSIPSGAGAVVSTPGDLGKFLRALFSGKLVSNESLGLMKSRQLGLFMMPFGEKKGYGHNGGIDGFSSNAAYFPEDGVAVAFTANGLDYSLNDFMIAVLSIYFGKDYQMPNFTPISLSEEELQAFTGTYSSEEFPLKIDITIGEGRLRGQASGQSSFPLEAYEGDIFRFDMAGLELEFFPEQNKMILKQGGGSYSFTRD